MEGEYVVVMMHLYCLAVQVGFYSDVVECRTLSRTDRVRSPAGALVIRIFFTCYISPSNKIFASANTRIHQDIKGAAYKGMVHSVLE